MTTPALEKEEKNPKTVELLVVEVLRDFQAADLDRSVMRVL